MKELLQSKQEPQFFEEKNNDQESYDQYLPGKGERYQASDFDKFGPAKKVYQDIVSRMERRAFYPPDTEAITEYIFFNQDYRKLSPEEQNEFLRQMLSVVAESRIKRELSADQSADDPGMKRYLEKKQEGFLEEDGLLEAETASQTNSLREKYYLWSNFFSNNDAVMDDFFIRQIIRNLGKGEVRNRENVDFL